MPERTDRTDSGPPSPSRRLDQSGGAISLWVVLMVPVAAFAAVVAMAGPQRMAAESSLQEAAHDLGTMAVVLRDGTNVPEGEIEGFLPICADDVDNPDLKAVCELLLGDETGGGGYLHRDLGHLGIDTIFWDGFYSASLVPRDISPTPAPGDPNRYYGDSLQSRNVSCLVSENLETRNAVYVALAADWESGGWAAAQAWPNGVRLGTEVVARLNQKKLPWTPAPGDPPSPGVPRPCDPTKLSPRLVSGHPRTVFSD